MTSVGFSGVGGGGGVDADRSEEVLWNRTGSCYHMYRINLGEARVTYHFIILQNKLYNRWWEG